MQVDRLTTFGIPYMSGDEIRASFLNFFEKRGHKIVPSANIAPQDDPTLLFVNSGMTPFKAIFLGENREGLSRVADSQKCLRVSGKHNDLDEVGRDGTHHTFFEMLGNWSFGDYYKKEAITWAWQLLTEVWQIPKNRLFVTVYEEDAEAAQLWQECTDVELRRILRFRKENFWEMGPVGPCGPCSEIHFDLGDLATQEQTFQDPVLGVNGANQRYIEIWNLVFMQFERLPDGSLTALAAKHVDTGSGFERVCSVIQGKLSNYETDVFTPLIAAIARHSGVPYHRDDRGVSHRVIADHVRALSFTIADGVTPGNEGRGYVMRRILRRACRFAHQLGQNEPFLFKIVEPLVACMGEAYPELKARASYITQVIQSEERRFLKTLDQGLQKMSALISKLQEQNLTQISGEDAFRFHDTYGFPLDLTEIIAAEKGLSLDSAGFEACMQAQQDRARLAAKFDASFGSEGAWSILKPGKETTFTGYTSLYEKTCHTHRYREDGDFIYVLLDRSPFYAEAGGQVGDTGFLFNDGQNPELRLRVLDTVKILEMHIHKCTLVSGLLSPESLAILTAQVDEHARTKTRRNHSATHLLHAALRQVLGPQVEQQGSLVSSERLRFDFTHHQALSQGEKDSIEDLVNRAIQQNLAIVTEVLPIEAAKKSGAMALFGEKYGDSVRVLSMGDFSKELCGGTHATATGDCGLFRIIQESSIASGVRRIEALTGESALALSRQEGKILQQLAHELKTPLEGIENKVTAMAKRLKTLEQTLADLQSKEARRHLDELVTKNRVSMGPVQVIIASLDSKVFTAEQLQGLVDTLADQLQNEVAFLTFADQDQLVMLAAVGQKALAYVKAGEMIALVSAAAGGRGGGRPNKARAGSKFPEKEAAALAAARKYLAEKLQG